MTAETINGNRIEAKPMNSPYILILYYSRFGHVEKLAEQLRLGVESEAMEARLRTVPTINRHGKSSSVADSYDGPLHCKESDLNECSGLLVGSPTRFGNMAAELKYFFDSTADVWLSGGLIGKPAGVFTSSSSFHGGQESTLLSMMIPLLHHGMILCGVPYSETALNKTKHGGTPYGSSHVESDELSPEERQICRTQGRTIARLTKKLM